jgi:superfamily II helicase
MNKKVKKNKTYKYSVCAWCREKTAIKHLREYHDHHFDFWGVCEDCANTIKMCSEAIDNDKT